MYQDKDLDLKRELPPNESALTQDLELNTLFNAMASDNKFILDVSKKVILTGAGDLDTIRYRQRILKDCLKNPSVIREIYQIPLESIQNKQKRWLGIFSRYPSGILSSAIEIMEMFVGLLKKLRFIADQHANKFESEGFTTFFEKIKKELDDDYFSIVQNHLKDLTFRNGVLLSAELGDGNEGTGYILRRPHINLQSWMKQVFRKRSPVYSFSIHPRDDHGAKALGDLKDRGINLVANAVAQSADHIDSFFSMLRTELAFYVGCLNLFEQLTNLGEPVTFPTSVDSHERKHSFHGLYDVCLALTMGQKVVGNDANADGKELVIITGANQGGKSTFLRSIGLAQLMMECGMFVPAESFHANVSEGLYTHFKREEDSMMESGKLDEELSRMSSIVDCLRPNSMVLFNESFAATNEREGSEIASQIVHALLDERIKVFFVTHLYPLANNFYQRRNGDAIFLRAERLPDGVRTFKLIEGKPLQTSFGEDLYIKIFDNKTAQ